MRATAAIDIYRRAKEALRLPGLSPADRHAIASEFISELNTSREQAPATLRAVRSAILKEANNAVRRTRSNASRKAPKKEA